jgi:DNA-binding winged helix-turn-helix (wHTH) protein/tetratricopeptide (TPR) repeat protein
MESQQRKLFAFSAFVFDALTGELRHNGKPRRMPPQVAQLLTILVQKPNAMVSREELRALLWPDGEILDYDHSINRAVSQLRAVLRERSSKSPLRIDTIPKRGYRFSAQVRELGESDAAVDSAPPTNATNGAIALAGLDGEPGPAISILATAALTTATPGPKPEPKPQATPAQPRATLRATVFKYRQLWVAFAVLALVLAGVGVVRYRERKATAAQTLSMGIVPFDATGDGAASLAESFRLDLADSLSQVPTIEIRAAHSFDDLGRDESRIQARAQELGIATILFGKLTVAADQCELRFEVVRSRDGVHLTSLQYSGTKDQLATIRDRIEQDLFQRLNPSGNANDLNLGRPASPKAYALYLRGRASLAGWRDDDLRQAIQAFSDASREDPNYARAYAGLSSAYFVLSQHGAGDRNANMDKARGYATTALTLDPSLAEAHAILGQVALNRDWNFEAASEQLHRATELDPDHAVYHQWLSILDCMQGKFDLALKEIDKAHAADPDWGPPYMTEIYVADTAHQRDRADRAAATLFRKMPNWSLAHDQNAMHLWASGRYAAAIDEWHLTAVMDKNSDRAQLEEQGMEAFRKGGVVAYARLRLQAIATRKGVSYEEYDFVPAEWHAYAGDWKQTLDDLEKLLATRSTEALQVGTNPAYAPLHKNQRFRAMLKRAGLPLPEEAASQ